MTYTYRLNAIKGNEIEYITTFTPLESGSIIGWGADKSEPDGIKRWKVQYQL